MVEFGDAKRTKSWIPLTIIVFLIVVTVRCFKLMSHTEMISFFLGIEGTALLACSFAPSVRNYGNSFKEKVKVFVGKQHGQPIVFDPILFYAGLLLTAISSITSRF